MADDSEIYDLYRLHSEGQTRYVYFLLAATGASLGYGLQRLDGVPFSWWVVPGLLALVFWLASFFCGCKRINWVHSTVYANYGLLQLKHGRHPDQPQHPEGVQAAMQGTRSAIESNVRWATLYFRLQFWFLLLGVISYVSWRVLEMLRLSNAP